MGALWLRGSRYGSVDFAVVSHPHALLRYISRYTLDDDMFLVLNAVKTSQLTAPASLFVFVLLRYEVVWPLRIGRTAVKRPKVI